MQARVRVPAGPPNLGRTTRTVSPMFCNHAPLVQRTARDLAEVETGVRVPQGVPVQIGAVIVRAKPEQLPRLTPGGVETIHRRKVMRKYANLSGKSGIRSFFVEDKFIDIQFNNLRTYRYRVSPGILKQMANLAEEGLGLNTFINQHQNIKKKGIHIQ